MSITTLRALLAIAFTAGALGGCGSLAKATGSSKSAPDEFKVLAKPPLVIPPEYGLRPPTPGENRALLLDPAAQAQAALFGRDVGRSATAGERALVAAAGAQAVDGNIRQVVDIESANVVRKSQGFTDRLLQFEDGADPLGPSTDAERLAEEEATRRVTGGEAVVIERKATKGKLPGL
jgi:hypothetical protein